MNYFLLNIALAFGWALINGGVTLGRLTFGFALGYFTLILVRRALPNSAYTRKGWLAIRLFFFFAWELFLSNLFVAYDVITVWEHSSSPRIIAVPLDVKTDAGVAALSHFISLTPGTLSLDVSSDKKTLYVHAMFAQNEDETRARIKNGLEKMIIRLLEE